METYNKNDNLPLRVLKLTKNTTEIAQRLSISTQDFDNLTAMQTWVLANVYNGTKKILAINGDDNYHGFNINWNIPTSTSVNFYSAFDNSLLSDDNTQWYYLTILYVE